MVNIASAVMPTIDKIYAHVESVRNEPPREHLGASVIGRPCARQLWYGFRWTKTHHHNGRLLLLFGDGHNAEAELTQLLEQAGVQVTTRNQKTGEQYRFTDCGGHFAGSMDGAAIGLAESPDKWHVLEFKTHNEKSFDRLKNEGVLRSKPEHYDQMQCYMGWTGIKRAFYLAKNKNTSELYSERVRFEADRFEYLRTKASSIIFSATPPPRINEDRAFYLCKWCDYSSVCHGDSMPEKNCRTCEHSLPESDGNASWFCHSKGSNLTADAQRKACELHKYPVFFKQKQLNEVDIFGAFA